MILLDTCTLIWLVTDQEHLSIKAKSAISENRGFLYSSSISAFEIEMKVKKKKLIIKSKTVDWYKDSLKLHGIKGIPLIAEILVESVNLPDHHNDPCDRMIIATAKMNNLSIITPDQLIKKYRTVKTIW